MKFLVGLEMLSREDKSALLAQLEAMTASGILIEAGSKVGHHLKEAVLTGSAKAAGRFSSDAAKWFSELDEKLDWDPERLRKCVGDIMRDLPSLTDQDFYVRWRYALSELGSVKPASTLAKVGESILDRAARGAGIKPNGYRDCDVMESDVVARCIQDVIFDLRTRMAKATPEELAKFEAVLEDEISKLSSADIETLRKYLRAEKLSGKVLLEFITAAGGFGCAQALIIGQGFAPYLILTTTIRAVSVWIGMTFPFAAYSTATAALAAFLSLWTLISVSAVAGAASVHSLGQKLHAELSKMVLIIGWIRRSEESD